MDNLSQTRAIQNKIFYDDVYDDFREQNFLYWLGNHPYLFQEFTDSGYITEAEIHYIIQHFFDYNVDPRTFENEFKRELREALPRYNNMKMIELVKEIFDLTDDTYTRDIVSQRATHLAQNGSKTSNGTNTTAYDNKQASRQLPMQTSGSSTIDNIVSWSAGASVIGENKNSGSTTINQSDANALLSDGTDNGNTKETYSRHGNPVDHIDKIWNYLLKPKAINYLTSALAPAFILVY